MTARKLDPRTGRPERKIPAIDYTKGEATLFIPRSPDEIKSRPAGREMKKRRAECKCGKRQMVDVPAAGMLGPVTAVVPAGWLDDDGTLTCTECLEAATKDA